MAAWRTHVGRAKLYIGTMTPTYIFRYTLSQIGISGYVLPGVNGYNFLVLIRTRKRSIIMEDTKGKEEGKPTIRRGARVTEGPVTGRLTKLITAAHASEHPVRRSRFYAGDLGFCSRASATFCLVSPDFMVQENAASQFYFNGGNAAHEVIEQGFEKAGILVAAEYHLQDIGMNLGGRIDDVIKLDDDYALVEIKTCGAIPGSPKPQNLAQLMVYLLVTGIDRGFLYYISRNVADFSGALKSAEFEVIPTEEDLYFTAYTMSVAYFSTLTKKQPPIPPNIKTRSRCGFCPFTSSCWDGSELKGVDKMTDSQFLEIHKAAEDHARRLMRTRKARAIQTKANFAKLEVAKYGEREDKEEAS